MTDHLVEKSELVPGTRYRVNLDDCCLTGGFAAKFMGWRVDAGEENNSNDWDAEWDNGVIIGPRWGQWSAFEEEKA